MSVVSNNDAGVLANGSSSRLSLSDVEVRDTQPAPDGTLGRGINVQEGALLEASSCRVSGNAEVGIAAIGEGTEVVLKHVEILNTQPMEDGTGGRGLAIEQGARLEAYSCLVSDNSDIGILAFNEGTEVVLQDVEVRDTRRGHATSVASGVASQDDAGLLASGLHVSGTEGPGLYIANGALSCSGCDLADNSFAGVVALGDSSLNLSSTTISKTRLDTNEGGGIGIYASVFKAGSMIRRPSITLDVIWQDCDGVDEPTGLDQAPVVDYCPYFNHHIAPLEFNLYLEEVELRGREGTARSAAAPDPFPSMAIQPSIPLLEPLPAIPSVPSVEKARKRPDIDPE